MASSSVKTFQVDIATNPSTIIVTAEPVAQNVPETIPVAHIIAVTPVFFDYGSPAAEETIAVASYSASPSEIVFPGAFAVDISIGDTIEITGSSSPAPTNKAITAYTSSPDTFTFVGNLADFIVPGSTVVIANSTNNNGSFTVVSAANVAGDTVVTVVEPINDAVVDGDVTFTEKDNDGTFTVVAVTDNGVDTTIEVSEPINPNATGGDIVFTPNSGTVENNDTGDSFRETYPYRRMTRLIIETYEGRKMDWELQSITNQPTWSLGKRDALKTAALAINALL